MASNLSGFENSLFYIGFNSLHGHTLSLSVNIRNINGEIRYSGEVHNNSKKLTYSFFEKTLEKIEDTIADNMKFILHENLTKGFETILHDSIEVCKNNAAHIHAIAGENATLEDKIQFLLNLTNTPDSIPAKTSFEQRSSEISILEILLPDISVTPDYIVTKSATGKLKFKKQTSSELSKFHKSIIYQLIFRAINIFFTADSDKKNSMLVINGKIAAIDKSTGNEKTQYITSLSISRDTYESLNLLNIDPEACFKSLRGLEIPRFNQPTPIAPIMHISREDSRFIESSSVIDNIQESTNLASLPWEEFVHLIREIFEYEFKSNGGEVKVTQASRDGGVDAIAFDPDPIRGGKIVIQAKRYTNTVGVSAVRDLYGTVLNEGATKGILVTTSSFGPDSYEFSKGKPITLLDGANLLYLFEKHGHKARINIAEAKNMRSDS